MSARRMLRGALAGAAVTLALGGCTYDYAQHSDRVAYSAGDAVRANLEAETINPSKGSMYSTAGLGRNGAVIPATGSGAPSSGSTAPTTVTAAPGG